MRIVITCLAMNLLWQASLALAKPVAHGYYLHPTGIRCSLPIPKYCLKVIDNYRLFSYNDPGQLPITSLGHPNGELLRLISS
jgi:hypothetical protein